MTTKIINGPLPLPLNGVLVLKLNLSTVEDCQEYMTNKEEQENILTKEIESWSKFEYALREEDSILFNKMLNECISNRMSLDLEAAEDSFFKKPVCSAEDNIIS